MFRRASQYSIEESCLRQTSRRASRAYLFLQVSVSVSGAVARIALFLDFFGDALGRF
jgi:hypothetical protein